VYGAAKLAGECYARAFHTTYGSHTVIVRPFNVFGPRSHHEGDSGEVIPKFMLRCLAGRPLVIFGDGMQSRDFTYVADAARGILLAGTVDGAAGKTINLGSGRMVTINELAAQVAAVAGCHDEAVERQAPRPGDIFQLCADWSKARELLGFEPQVDFIEGLAKLRDWYLGLGRSAEELLAEDVERNWGSNDVAAAAR
jgi:UDP-glucose 4-epimerase